MKTLTVCAYSALLSLFGSLVGCYPSGNAPSAAPSADASCKHDCHQVLSFPDGAHGLRSCATIQNANGENLLNLGSSDGYYNMGVEASKFISKRTDYSFAVCYLIADSNHLDGYGHFIFACSELAENGPDEGPYVAYRLNEQRFEISTGGYMHEEAVMAGRPSATGKWVVAIYRQSGHRGELFIDGKLIASNEFMPYPAEVFKSAPNNNWIGRAPFKGDKFLTDTKVRFLNLYDYALSDQEIEQLSKQ